MMNSHSSFIIGASLHEVLIYIKARPGADVESRGESTLRRPVLLAERNMPYYANRDLPSSVRDHLPLHAQDIYRAAFNRSYAAHAGDARCEEIAHRIAWAAVKHSYFKDGDLWVPRSH